MAGKEFPLSIILRTVDKSTAVLRAVEAKMGGVAKRMDAIAKKTAKIGKSLTTNITAPIVGIGVASVKTFSDFEDGLASVATLVDTTAVDMDELGKGVLDISKNVPVGFGDLNAALFDLISGGTDAGDAIERLDKSAKLGVAGLGTTAEAAALATGAINAFKLEGDEAAGIYDKIFKTTKNGITTISGLSRGFGAVAPKVAATGTEIGEYLAAVSALTTTTTPASVVHTQLAAVMAGLTRKTKDTSKIFRRLGAKDLKDLIQKSGGLVPALGRITDKLKGNEAEILKLVGSTEAMGAVLGLTGNQADAFAKSFADINDNGGETEEFLVAFNKKNATTAANLKKTKNALAAAAIGIGKQLLPVVEKLTEKLTEASEWWENLDDDTKKTIATIAGVAATAGPVLLVLGKLAGAFAAVTKVVRVMSAVMAANPIGALATIIALAALEIRSEWQSFEEFWELLWSGISAVIEFQWKIIKAIVDKIVGAVETVKNAAGDLADLVTGEDLDVGTAAGDIQRQIELASSGLGPPALGRGINGAPGAPGGAGAGGTSKIEIDIKNAPQGTRVKTTSDERAIDVTTGFQMSGT